MNAKLLIELEGVEAGGQLCAECDHLIRPAEDDYEDDSFFCGKFNQGDSLNCGLDDEPLRCPACLAAEEAMRSTRPKGEMPSITVELWEADEYVICVDGSPTGGTLSRSDAYSLRDWLKSETFREIIVRIIGPEKGGKNE